MRPSEIRELTEGEFDVRMGELEEELFGLRIKRATGQLENPMKVRAIRHDLARFLTVKQERQRKRASEPEQKRAGAA